MGARSEDAKHFIKVVTRELTPTLNNELSLAIQRVASPASWVPAAGYVRGAAAIHTVIDRGYIYYLV